MWLSFLYYCIRKTFKSQMLVYCSLTAEHSYAQIEPAVFHDEKNIELLILLAEADLTHCLISFFPA